VNTPCPWSDLAPASITFCEARLCAWIQTPANTWSNLAFVIVGYLICVRAYREHQEKLAVLGLISILLGLGSFIFHATATYIGEILDVGAMFLLVIYAITFSMWRTFHLKPKTLVLIYALLSFISIGWLIQVHWMGITIFAALVSVVVLFEVYLQWFSDEVAKRKDLAMVVGCFTLSYIIWWGDITGRWCSPNNHLVQGHAIWHTLNAFSVYFLYKFYKQFMTLNQETQAS